MAVAEPYVAPSSGAAHGLAALHGISPTYVTGQRA